MNTRFQAISQSDAAAAMIGTLWLLAAVLSSCGPNEKLRADYKAAAEAWAAKNKLQDPVVTCVADRGSCSVSWSAADGRRVTGLSCNYVNGPGSVECYAP